MRCLSSLLGVLALFPGQVLAAPVPEADAKKAVQEFVEAKKATAGQVTALTDPALGKAVPDRALFSLRFRQFPIAFAPPEGFSASNILAVDGQGKVTLVPTVKELHAFARARFLAGDDATAKLAVRAWLLLHAEIVQDGFYKFQVIDESLKTSRQGDHLEASGRLIVMQGGNGEIAVRLTFDSTGTLLTIKDTAKLVEGPRPICQATKLLDPDPLVRQICEADLLIMGRAAREYLLEQRARASKALQAEIDRVWQRIERGER